MQRRKLRQARNEPLRTEGGHHRQVQHIAFFAAHADFLRVALDLLQVQADARSVAAAGVGQQQAAARAQEQRHAQARFERRHMAAHRAGRERQLLGRTRKALQPRRCLEGLQHPEAGDVLAHGFLIFVKLNNPGG